MLISFVITAILLSFFLLKIRGEIEKRDSALTVQRAQNEKLAALTALAASVAHELRTPLASMRLAVDDLKLLKREASEVRDDISLLDSELHRASQALGRLGIKWGELQTEKLERLSIAEIKGMIHGELSPEERLWTVFETEREEQTFVGPRAALQHIVTSVVRNAHDATDDLNDSRDSSRPRVTVTIAIDESSLEVRVVDRGVGMSREEIAAIGTPFFTKKSSARGLGLGLYVTKLLCERLGGALSIVSAPGEGAAVSVRIPLSGGPAPD